MSFLWEHFIF